MLLDLLSQIEPDDSWRPQYPDPKLQPFPLAAYTVSFVEPLLTVTGHGPGPSGILRAGSVRQYMAVAAPLFVGTVSTPTIEWLPELPQPIVQPRRASGWVAFTELESPIGMEWLGALPTPVHLAGSPNGWFAFVQTVAIPDRSWAPTFPDRLTQPSARAAYQPGTYSLVVDTLSGHGPGPSGILWMGRMRQYQSLAAPLFVEPPITRVLAWAIYPDRLNRVTLPAALVPSFFYGTWVPIPNPPTTLILEDRILIGQNQSIETPFYPSIGGSTTWS